MTHQRTHTDDIKDHSKKATSNEHLNKEARKMTKPTPDPTPAEIKKRCAAIQATWTPAERMRRMRHDWRPLGITAGGDMADEPSRTSESVTGDLVAPERLQGN